MGDIPGVSAKELSIELENDSVLCISGSRQHKNQNGGGGGGGGGGGMTTESKFEQRFQMDNDVDPEGLEVTLSHGVLRVSAPKKEKVVKRLEIKTVNVEDEEHVALETK